MDLKHATSAEIAKGVRWLQQHAKWGTVRVPLAIVIDGLITDWRIDFVEAGWSQQRRVIPYCDHASGGGALCQIDNTDDRFLPTRDGAAKVVAMLLFDQDSLPILQKFPLKAARIRHLVDRAAQARTAALRPAATP